MARLGLQISTIQLYSRHSSDAIMTYVQQAPLEALPDITKELATKFAKTAKPAPAGDTVLSKEVTAMTPQPEGNIMQSGDAKTSELKADISRVWETMAELQE